MTNLEPGDIVMCTVERIAGTIVFVKIDGDGQGSIILSEIAPGRIRNLRQYVVPKKKIICKVLRVVGDRIDLSLRRVTPKEQKEIKEKYKLEKSYRSVLKSVLKENATKITETILKESSLYDFLEEAKEDSKSLEKMTGKEDSKKILDILNTQKQKTILIKKQISLTTPKPNGVTLIKKALGEIKEAKVKYLSAGKYTIQIESSDPKKAAQKLREILENLEKNSKTNGLVFSIKEK